MRTTLFSSKFFIPCKYKRVDTDIHSVITYPLAVVNTFVAGGLIILYLKPTSASRSNYGPTTWTSPVHATLPVAIFFCLSNIFLVVAPFVPPESGQNVYKHLWYALHAVVGIAIFAAGGVYWLIWAKLMPWIGKYSLVREGHMGDDGWTKWKIVRRPKTANEWNKADKNI